MTAPYTLRIGDSWRLLRQLDEASVDSIVTDPPYELGFMDRAWDASGVAFSRRFWAEALRVLKPGGHLLAFGATRTYHRLACAIEDAGFDMRDQLAWVWEPIAMARKPFRGTTQACRDEYGTGGINVDACLVPLGDDAAAYRRNCPGDRGHGDTRDRGATDLSQGGGRAREGRWPANILHDGSDDVLAAFPNGTGQRAPVSGLEPSAAGTGVVLGLRTRVASGPVHDGPGNASRFFYCAKPTPTERHAGLAGEPDNVLARSNGAKTRAAAGVTELASSAAFNAARIVKNHHPTVKPIAVGRWLQRLVTPAGGTTLDLFAGSGTFGMSAILEGFHPVLFELDRDADGKRAGFEPIIRARCAWAVTEAMRETRAREELAAAAAQRALQLSLLEA